MQYYLNTNHSIKWKEKKISALKFFVSWHIWWRAIEPTRSVSMAIVTHAVAACCYVTSATEPRSYFADSCLAQNLETSQFFSGTSVTLDSNLVYQSVQLDSYKDDSFGGRRVYLSLWDFIPVPEDLGARTWIFSLNINLMFDCHYALRLYLTLNNWTQHNVQRKILDANFRSQIKRVLGVKCTRLHISKSKCKPIFWPVTYRKIFWMNTDLENLYELPSIIGLGNRSVTGTSVEPIAAILACPSYLFYFFTRYAQGKTEWFLNYSRQDTTMQWKQNETQYDI